MQWTDERVEELKRLHKDNLSCAQIANELGGVSRNAVIGKLTRLGLNDGKRFPAKPKLGRQRAKRFLMARQKLTQIMFEDAPETLIPVGEPLSRNLTLFQLTSKTCRWPAGNDPPFHFCGHGPQFGSPYCPFHAQLSLPPHQRKVSRKSDTATANQKELATA